MDNQESKPAMVSSVEVYVYGILQGVVIQPVLPVSPQPPLPLFLFVNVYPEHGKLFVQTQSANNNLYSLNNSKITPKLQLFLIQGFDSGLNPDGGFNPRTLTPIPFSAISF